MERDMDKLLKEYGEFAKCSPLVEFDESDVPENLRNLIPYARFWGISDDLEREVLSEAADQSVKDRLKALIAENDDLLDDWLAGEEADSLAPSDAYVAFSAMRMCADFF